MLKTTSSKRAWTLTAMAAAALVGLAGCDRNANGDRMGANNETGPMAQVDQKARDIGSDVKAGAQRMGTKIDDATITASVKTELAKDSDLSAMSINVDTDNGRVALKGTAPSPTAKEHASSLAPGVRGVTGVDNQLTVDATKK